MEKALPSLRLNQKALEEPPSRFSARWILKSPKLLARMPDRSASETSEQNPSAARSPLPTAAKGRLAARVADRVPSSRAAGCPRSTRNGPHSTAAGGFERGENSLTRNI